MLCGDVTNAEVDWIGRFFCSLFFVPILDPLRMDVLSI